MDMLSVMAAVTFGIIGMALMVHGKKTSNIAYLVCGCLLMVFPYIITGFIWTILVGSVICYVAWWFRD